MDKLLIRSGGGGGGGDFISVWRTTTPNETITLLLQGGFTYNATIDWGDGSSVASITAYNDPDRSHVYASPGDYTITISGTFETIQFNYGPMSSKIISITNLGSVGWKSFNNAFAGCDNLTTVSGGDTSQVTDMTGMFVDALYAAPETSAWNTSQVTSMAYMFAGTAAANPDVSNWDTSNVENMALMFGFTHDANPNVRNWNTSKVTDMSGMFEATYATPDVSNWVTSSATDMYGMFYDATAANPIITNWDTSQVTTMAEMFNNANNLVAPNFSNWNFSSITDMSGFLNGTFISTPSYNTLLNRINTTTLATGITLSGGSAKYNNVSKPARDNLIANGWVITDGGEGSPSPMPP